MKNPPMLSLLTLAMAASGLCMAAVAISALIFPLRETPPAE